MRKTTLAVLSAVLLTGTALAQQTTGYSSLINYYSDASKTVLVGRDYTSCADGETYLTGERTEFYTYKQGNCP